MSVCGGEGGVRERKRERVCIHDQGFVKNFMEVLFPVVGRPGRKRLSL